MLFTPSPLSQTVTPSRTPFPLERDVLYGRPLNDFEMILNDSYFQFGDETCFELRFCSKGLHV